MLASELMRWHDSYLNETSVTSCVRQTLCNSLCSMHHCCRSKLSWTHLASYNKHAKNLSNQSLSKFFGVRMLNLCGRALVPLHSTVSFAETSKSTKWLTLNLDSNSFLSIQPEWALIMKQQTTHNQMINSRADATPALGWSCLVQCCEQHNNKTWDAVAEDPCPLSGLALHTPRKRTQKNVNKS
jgi:hypothetical protein